MQTVSYVDYDRYLGKWYDIAHLPFGYQPQNATNTTATYGLISADPLKISVDNRSTMPSGQEIRAQGVATLDQSDPNTNAKLNVDFGIESRDDGKYWILMLDEANYQWAVVGHPNRQMLWILSRTPKISRQLLQEIFYRLQMEHGYDPGVLQSIQYTHHSQTMRF